VTFLLVFIYLWESDTYLRLFVRFGFKLGSRAFQVLVWFEYEWFC